MSRRVSTGGARRPKKKKPSGGLTKWFNEEWVDVKTGKPCGRKSANDSERPYPSCRPKAVAAKMTKAEKASSSRRKTGPQRIAHAVTASGRRRKTTKKA
jgi:hypothetical protein